jgi:hypothetical protein
LEVAAHELGVAQPPAVVGLSIALKMWVYEHNHSSCLGMIFSFAMREACFFPLRYSQPKDV